MFDEKGGLASGVLVNGQEVSFGGRHLCCKQVEAATRADPLGGKLAALLSEYVCDGDKRQAPGDNGKEVSVATSDAVLVSAHARQFVQYQCWD